jgi:protein kinase-like protein
LSVADCPDTEDFAALLSGALAAPRRASITEHAAGCTSCHVLLAALADAPRTVGSQDAAAPTPRPPGDTDRARAPVSVDRRHKIGRYHLLEIVGTGGMGMVWGAWDPELARRVALKLVHPRLEAARDRLVAEGQALGRLSHPHVVPIYDVGVVDDQVYLVMEWVHGTTLRAYAASPCTQRELVAAYRQAGEGLAAAHRAGLVHRDFKPDNAIRGDDGRVRVLDFGLARSEHDAPDQVKRLAGTPRYMPPEQAAGATVTPAADQFAFAVSLREALARPAAGRRAELPGWLAAILARATAPAPADRFPAMEPLLHALGRDPARIWRRRGIALAAAAVAVAAFVAGRSHGDAAPTCVGGAPEIARSWNPAVRAAMAAHLHGLGAFGAGEADRLGAQLDRYSAAWADEHRRACVAHERGELPTALYERRLGCLARGQAALTTVAELMTSVAADGLPPALVAARSLPSAAGCTAAALSAVAPPPDAIAARVAAVAPAIERARVLAVAARPDAITVARAGVAAAEATGYAPLIARALLAQGRAELELNAGEAAAPASLGRALDLALRSGDDLVAVEAYARLVWAIARYRGDAADNWSAMAAIAARTGPPGRFGRALLYNNKAIARIASHDRAGARGFLQQALAAAASRPLADDELELTSIPQNLALVSDDPAEREARTRQVVDQLAAALGPHHPDTLRARFFAATLTRSAATAAADLALACDGYQRWHPQLTVEFTDCAFERGWLADDGGDLAGARAAMRIAAEDPLAPRERAKGTIAAAYLQLTGDPPPAAITALTALHDIEAVAARQANAPELWNRGDAADAYVTAALGLDRLGPPRDAERAWRAALGLLESLDQPIFERRLARVRATLARRWAHSRPADARRLAGAAIAWYRAAGGYDAAIAALAALVAPG